MHKKSESATIPATLPVNEYSCQGWPCKWRRARYLRPEPRPATTLHGHARGSCPRFTCFGFVSNRLCMVFLQQVLQTAALTQTILTVETDMAYWLSMDVFQKCCVTLLFLTSHFPNSFVECSFHRDTFSPDSMLCLEQVYHRTIERASSPTPLQ